MFNSVRRKWLGAALALQLGLAGCATPQREPAVPASSMAQANEALGPVRFLVSRETDSFAAEARRSLDKERQWLASQGRGPDLPPVERPLPVLRG